jgi:hypothetical protein
VQWIVLGRRTNPQSPGVVLKTPRQDHPGSYITQQDRGASGVRGLSKQRLFAEAILAWSFSVCLVAISGYAAGIDPFTPSSYVRWDSGFYLDIAQSGYQFSSCEGVAGYDPTQWCGNGGWMPGYPLVLKLLHTLQLNGPAAGLLCSWGFFFGSLILLRLLIEEVAPGRENIPCFLAASVFPGGIYYFGVFPISLLMFLALLAMRLAVRERFLAASLVAAAGAFVYSTGFLLSGVVAAAVLIARNIPWPRRLGEAALYGAIAFAGLGAVMILHAIVLDHWNAFFLVQAKYGHAIHNPLATIANAWRSASLARNNEEEFIGPAQSLIVCGIVPAILAYVVMRFREITRIEQIAAVHVTLFWLFPLVMGDGVSLVRADANLLPLTILLARLPQAAQSVVVAIFAFLYFEVGVAFFKAVLV